MIKSFKRAAVILIIVGILSCIAGVLFSNVAKADRGVQVYSTINGKTVSAGYMGANKKGEETASAASVVMYIASGLFIIGGIACAVHASRKNSAQTVRQHGTVIEKEKINNTESVTVEFDDHSRKKLFVEPPVLVAKGDVGVFGYKGNLLVEFVKK